ncbi:MAG TPA: sodium-dependent transporter [Pseudomonadales bacterium]|nr:sodium-dependent transporter [Pseudomonadales bacterium]
MPGPSAVATPGWTSRFAFLMASIGFAVGLGNIWRFPYATGENGGGAFVLVYVATAFVIGVPILIAELMIGRRGGMTPPGSMRTLAVEEGQSRHWQIVGSMSMLTAFLIMITYSVVAGWVLEYLVRALLTGFEGVDGQSAAAAYNQMFGEIGSLLFWTFLALFLTGSILFAGVKNGIERAVTVLMPTLFLLMVGLMGYNITVGGFSEAVDYLFIPDFSKVNPGMLLAAIGQAFFSIGVAMAGMMTYGAYLPRSVSIPRSAMLIVIADTAVALLAGLVIFPAVFNNGLDPAGGPGLIFKTLPVAFAQMPGGHLVSVLFFLLLSVAAVTSMVGLTEPLVRWLEEGRDYSRHKSTALILGSIAALSTLSVLGYNLLSNLTLAGKDINSLADYVSNQIMLPLGGLLIAVFIGWFVRRQVSFEELDISNETLFELWHFLIRYVVPPTVFIVFVLGVGW